MTTPHRQWFDKYRSWKRWARSNPLVVWKHVKWIFWWCVKDRENGRGDKLRWSSIEGKTLTEYFLINLFQNNTPQFNSARWVWVREQNNWIHCSKMSEMHFVWSSGWYHWYKSDQNQMPNVQINMVYAVSTKMERTWSPYRWPPEVQFCETEVNSSGEHNVSNQRQKEWGGQWQRGLMGSNREGFWSA